MNRNSQTPAPGRLCLGFGQTLIDHPSTFVVAKIGSWRKGRLLTRPGRPGSLRYLSGDVNQEKRGQEREGKDTVGRAGSRSGQETGGARPGALRARLCAVLRVSEECEGLSFQAA